MTLIVEYAGMPMKFPDLGAAKPVTEREATQFCNEAEAWHTAHNFGLSPNHVAVINLDERYAAQLNGGGK